MSTTHALPPWAERSGLQVRKTGLKNAAADILSRAERENRDLTPAETTEHASLLGQIGALQTRMDDLPLDGVAPLAPGQQSARRRGQSGHAIAGFPEALRPYADWVRGKIGATSTPLQVEESPISSGLAASISVDVLDSLQTYSANDPFSQAGATIYQTDDTAPLVKPVILPGADFDTFTEGQSSTDSKPFGSDAFTFGGQKYSRLVLASEESLMNVALDLPAEIISELGASVASTFTKAISLALQTALYSNAATFVENGSDTYEAILSLIAAVPPRFESPSNAFMGTRHMLKVIRNTRATDSGVPLFNPQDGTVLGRRFVINDSLTRLVYGQWQAGAFIRKSPFFLQRLLEAYASTGHQGFRGTQWLDQHFLAEISSADQPLYYVSLETEGS